MPLTTHKIGMEDVGIDTQYNLVFEDCHSFGTKS